MQTVAVRVTGRVQGVGYRAYVVSQARARGLRGEVWNATDGSVRAIFQADSVEQAQAMLALLEAGPGVVTEVQSESLAEPRVYQGFEVSPTRAA